MYIFGKSLTQKPMVPGDEVDNDNDGMVDEDKCDESSLCKFSNQTLTLFRTNRKFIPKWRILQFLNYARYFTLA